MNCMTEISETGFTPHTNSHNTQNRYLTCKELAVTEDTATSLLRKHDGTRLI